MLNRTLDSFVEKLTAEARVEGWTTKRVKLVERAARKGHPTAQRLLASLKE
jgi:hypothetical protein